MMDDVNKRETELLVRLKSGDETAFSALYKQHSGRLYHNILRLVKIPEIAQDLLQDLFLKIWEKRSSIVITQDLDRYLFRVAVNMVHDFFRKLTKDRDLYESVKAAAVLEWRPDEYPDHEAIRSVVHHALDTLPPQRKKIFYLCKMEGKSYQEVSRLMDISTSTINDHIVKASRTIREFVLSHPEKISLCIAALLLRQAG